MSLVDNAFAASFHRLAELMGGSITVHSELNVGADFIFYIKSARARSVELKKQSRGRLRPSKFVNRSPGSNRSSFSTNAAGSPDPTGSGDSRETVLARAQASATIASLPPEEGISEHRNRLRILVAEDNLLNQKLLQRQISKAGISVKVANNGLEAIERLKQAAAEDDRCNVCLMDLE